MRTATSVFVIATTVEDRTVCCECVNVRALIDNCFGTECLVNTVYVSNGTLHTQKPSTQTHINNVRNVTKSTVGKKCSSKYAYGAERCIPISNRDGSGIRAHCK